MSSCWGRSWMSLPLQALWPSGLTQVMKLELEAPEVELSWSLKYGGALNQSLQWIPLLFITNNPRIVILHHIHPFLNSIPPLNSQRQPHNNCLSQQIAYPSCYDSGKCLAKIHFLCHQHSSHIWIPNSSRQNDSYCPNLLCQTLGSEQALNAVLVASDSVSSCFTTGRGILRPDFLNKIFVFKFVVDFGKNMIQYWNAIIWMKDFFTILHLPQNLTWTVGCFLFVCNNRFQLLQCKLGRWDYTLVLLKFIVMLGTSPTSNHWKNYLWME